MIKLLLICAFLEFGWATPKCYPGSTYLPSKNCNQFYQCANGHPFLFTCPAGTHFNKNLNICDWPHNARCEDSNQPTRCSAIDGPQSVYFPDEDCGKFWQCSNGVPILQHCPSGTHFNPSINVCDWPQNAGCLVTTTTNSPTIKTSWSVSETTPTKQEISTPASEDLTYSHIRTTETNKTDKTQLSSSTTSMDKPVTEIVTNTATTIDQMESSSTTIKYSESTNENSDNKTSSMDDKTTINPSSDEKTTISDDEIINTSTNQPVDDCNTSIKSSLPTTTDNLDNGEASDEPGDQLKTTQSSETTVGITTDNESNVDVTTEKCNEDDTNIDVITTESEDGNTTVESGEEELEGTTETSNEETTVEDESHVETSTKNESSEGVSEEEITETNVERSTTEDENHEEASTTMESTKEDSEEEITTEITKNENNVSTTRETSEKDSEEITETTKEGTTVQDTSTKSESSEGDLEEETIETNITTSTTEDENHEEVSTTRESSEEEITSTTTKCEDNLDESTSKRSSEKDSEETTTEDVNHVETSTKSESSEGDSEEITTETSQVNTSTITEPSEENSREEKTEINNEGTTTQNGSYVETSTISEEVDTETIWTEQNEESDKSDKPPDSIIDQTTEVTRHEVTDVEDITTEKKPPHESDEEEDDVSYICLRWANSAFLTGHPRNCNLYISCIYGETYVMPCPSDLWFDEIMLRCVLPEKSRCQIRRRGRNPIIRQYFPKRKFS